MGVTVKILSNKFPGLPGKFRSLSGQLTQQTAEKAKKRAQDLVPVDSGETRDHIEAIKLNPFTWVLQSTRPSTDGDFDVPSYLEYKVKSYMRPAVEEQRGPFLDGCDKLIDKAVR